PRARRRARELDVVGRFRGAADALARGGRAPRGAAVFRPRVRADPPALVVDRRDRRRALDRLSPRLSRAHPAVPAEHRRADADLGHARRRDAGDEPRAPLARVPRVERHPRHPLRRSGTLASRRGAIAQAVPGQRDHRPRLEPAVRMEAFRVQAVDPEKRAVGRLLRFALIGSVVLAVILLLLLALASANTELFESQYPMLLWLTVGLAVGLLLLVLELLRRLVVRYRRGLFGTRLMARMAVSFTLMTVLPVALIYLVSVQFVGRSIESWFAVPVERGLESGLTLGRTALDSLLSDLAQKARNVAVELSDTPRSSWPETLNLRREQLGIGDALIASGTGRIITTSGSRFAGLVPDLPPPGAMRQARLMRQYA